MPTNSGFGHACAALYKTSDSQEVKCWGADYSGQVSDAPSNMIKTSYFYPAFQSTLTQSEPVANENAESASYMTASMTFSSIILMMIYF